MKKLILIMLLLCALFSSGCLSGKEAGGAAPGQTKQMQQAEQQSFVVYRAAADGTEKLLPERLTIAGNGRSIQENALIALVSSKPQDARMDDVVPIGTKVLGLRIAADGTAYADFSRELARKGQGSYGELMLCYAITNTLTEFKEIKRVQILIEGKKVASLGGHMDLEDPLTRNKSLL